MAKDRRWLAAAVVLAVVAAACGSSKKAAAPPTTIAGGTVTTAGGTATTAAPLDLGTGVTATTVKVGVALVDFTCIEAFTNQIRVNQQQVYQAFFDDVNKHGGLAGRQIVPVYHSYCPIQSAQALALCTTFTEDDKVFAVLGNFVDFSGDAQTCLAKQHKTVLITFQLTQAIMNLSPPGLIILPGSNPERIDTVLFGLLQKQGTLVGRKVAVLGETVSQPVVNSSVLPDLRKLGVAMGSTAILTVTGTDTSQAHTQLESFIERWKSEHVDTLFVTGDQVASQQFIEKVRADMPNIMLISDSDVIPFGRQEHHIHRVPNPYEGIIVAGGPTSTEYNASSNWAYCSSVYQAETGKVAPNALTVIPAPGGKTLDTYGSINDACQIITLFHDIAVKVGADLNVANWVKTVDNYGPIRNMGGGQYASLHTGKYDIDDTFRLEQFDSSIPPDGDPRPLTPLQNLG